MAGAAPEVLSRRKALLAGLATLASAAAALPARANPPGLKLEGRFVQGGFAMGRTAPRAAVYLDDELAGPASTDGLFIVGFDRDAADSARLKLSSPDGEVEHDAAIAKGDFDVQVINGLPQDTVTPTDPALLARIKEETARKNVGFASRVDTQDFQDGFIIPVQATRQSARFGGQRILNGVPMRPHYGADLAAPIGTPIVAPAPGLICFAETGLHYEGGLTMIDHGQGFISLYLHQSHLDVAVGQKVERGQLIGLVGMEGRATGPHLCWRLWWRGRHLDPMLLVGERAPAV